MPTDWRWLAVFTPLMVWGLLFELCRLRTGRRRVSLLMASIVWGTAVTLMTEIASLFNAVNYHVFFSGWLMLLSLLILPVISEHRHRVATGGYFDVSAHKIIIIPGAAILLVTLLIALIAPPNNFDSMTYHMPRVMHWIQNGSVAHYPTHIIRQIELNPWAEYAIMHLQILSGGDHFANIVQWFSMLGSVAGVSLIAGLLSADSKGQALSGLVALTLPMAILQSSSTQNDLIVSFWLVCFVYFGLRSAKEHSSYLMLMMSCSLGLAILTKGTAYIFALPFLFWIVICDVRMRWPESAFKILLIGLVVVCLNAGHYCRNFGLFHNPLGSGSDSYFNSQVTIGVVASNVVRNIALHLITPSEEINSTLVSILRSLSAVVHVDLEDPGSTWPGTSFAALGGVRMGPHEDTSANSLHLMIYLVVGALLLKKAKKPHQKSYAVAVTAGFILFCVMLRWQPWHSRLHLPLFILFAPLAGTMLAEIWRERLVPVLAILLVVAVLPWVFCNINRPIISLASIIPRYPSSIVTTPRRTQYVYNRSGIEQSYLDVAAIINTRGVKNIGVNTGGNGWEYPLWIFTRTNGLDGPRIEHVYVKNKSGDLPRKPFMADMVVKVGDDARVCVE